MSHPRSAGKRTAAGRSAGEVAAGYRRIERAFAAWAEGQEGIRAAAVVGSRARTDHPADEWSDLDVVAFADDPARYTRSADWIREFGTPWLTFVEPTAVGEAEERRVLYEGGLDVDFAFLPTSLLVGMSEREGLAPFADPLRRGLRILLDRGGRLARAASSVLPDRPASRPTQAEFDQVVSDFWYHAVWTAKHLRRGELWWAKGACDGLMKERLRTMMAWHAQATRGPEADTWMRGRFLEEWADPRARAELPRAFAHYDEDDVWRALSATTGIFGRLAAETAARLRLTMPEEGIAQAQRLVGRLDRERQGRRPSPARARADH